MLERIVIQWRNICLPILLLIAAVSSSAGSLEFRSDGFFASPDARVKLWRESWRHAPHLDVDGVLAVSLDGPILRPGYHTSSGATTKTEVDAVRRIISETGMLGTMGVPYRRTLREFRNGLLMRLEFAQTPPAVNEAVFRMIFPINVFKNRYARWDGSKLLLPVEKPEAGRLVFRDDPGGKSHQFRIDLGNGRDLGVQFFTPLQGLTFADCRQWNEMNYHLQARFAGNILAVYLCVLAPDEAFPPVELPAEQPAPPPFRRNEAGACVQLHNRRVEVQVTHAGQIAVRQNGGPYVDIEVPFVKEGETYSPLGEPVSFSVDGNRVEVVTRAKQKPFRVRQILTVNDDEWASVSTTFEGVDAQTQAARVEAVLPEERFAGATIRAGERFVELPAGQPGEALLVNDWDGKVLEYALPVVNGGSMAFVCDEKRASYLTDYRKWKQGSYKIGLTPRGNTIRYRLHFQQAGDGIVNVKGNLLRNGNSFETGPEGVRPFASYSWTEKMVGKGVAPVFDTGTAVHGATSLRLTASDAVRLGNPRGFAFVGALFNRVQLKRDRHYTVSAYLKADRPGLKAVLYCGETTWAGQEWGDIPVTTEWKRYSIPFFTGDFRRSGYYLTWAGLAPGCREGTVWIDAVQLEEGDLTPFRPAEDVEYGVEVEREARLFEAEEPCRIRLRVRNNSMQRINSTVTYAIRDYWGREARTGAVTVSVNAESTIAQEIKLGILPCGYYQGYFTTPDGTVKETIFGVYQPQPLTPLPNDWPLACHNDPSPLVRKLGFGAVRAFDVFDFSVIAQKAGEFDFSRADRLVAQAQACGLAVMPILGDFRWPGYRPDAPIPAYAREKVTEKTVAGRLTRLAWPTQDAWKAYVRSLTERYKGRVREWEVLNEPNLMMTPEEYLPYLKSAYEAAKAGDPDCRVVGVCATSDFSGKPGSFTDAVLRLGGAAYFDILSVHLYHPTPPERTLNVGSDTLLTDWRHALSTQQGRDIPVWHSERSYIIRELGYSRDKVNVPLEYCDEPQFLIDTLYQKAEYMIRETLLDAVAGKGGRFFWFGLFADENSFISNRYSQPYGLGHSEYDLAPMPELLAANGLARTLEGRSHPVRLLHWGDAARGAVFSGEKGAVAALWHWQGGGRLKLPVGTARCMLQNFFGEPIPIIKNMQGEPILDLAGAPCYLIFPDLGGEACVTLLGGAQLE